MVMLVLLLSTLGCRQVARELAEVGASAGARRAAQELAEGGAKVAGRGASHADEVGKLTLDIAAQVAQQGGFSTEDVDLSGEWSLDTKSSDEWSLRGSAARTRIDAGTYRSEASMVMSKMVDSTNVVIQASFVAVEIWGESVECYKLEKVRSVNVLADGLESSLVTALEGQIRGTLEEETRKVSCDTVLQRTSDLVVTRDDEGDISTERRISR
jgi:hypothetical protein